VRRESICFSNSQKERRASGSSSDTFSSHREKMAKIITTIVRGIYGTLILFVLIKKP
jgi:hypothetical protein